MSRMSTRSPEDSKKIAVKTEEEPKREAPSASKTESAKATPPQSDAYDSGSSRPPVTAQQVPDSTSNQDTQNSSNAEQSQPLAPPPRPTQSNPTDTPDYFSSVHNSSHFSLEPNPFEQSFGNPSSETPGKSLLPPVAALASPASLIQGGASAGGFNWTNSLRSGPLSPAMLTGPTGSSDYFDGHLRGGFPTPNESSLRTGLTPGGGGSMFPAPSPNSQALFQALASGGATPNTLDFHRTAMNAAAAKKSEKFGYHIKGHTSEGQEQASKMDQKAQPTQHQEGNQSGSDPFGQHDANDAANGLFLLAQARGGSQANSQFAIPEQPNANTHSITNNLTPAARQAGTHSQATSPNLAKRATRNVSGSGGPSVSGSARGMSDISGDFSDSGASEQTKPNTRAKGKKGNTGKVASASNGRRKVDDTQSKGPANKKLKVNSGSIDVDMGIDSDDEGSVKQEEELHESGRKMTDEEKRKNFLERNRVAALKCRQRKKQWLANLQAKVEIFSSENDSLSAQVTQYREEIVNLKTLLLAHKDCPVSQAQGLGGMAMNSIGGDYSHNANPYGMAMANGGQVMGSQGMQRRYS